MPCSPVIGRRDEIRKQSPSSRQGVATNCRNKSNQKTRPFLKKVAGVLAIFLFWRRTATPDRDDSGVNPKHSQLGGVSLSTNSSASSHKGLSNSKHSSSYASSKATEEHVGAVDLSMEEILKATENFSRANKIGEGGYGTVYKGKLSNGSLVAIKRAKNNTYDTRLSTEFKNEVLMLSKIEHLSLVRLYGYLEHGDEKILVVEYVGNRTLREHLDGLCGNGLEITERLDIAIDVAHAITYLHIYSDPPIIHRDIKASNILITEKLRAKVSDFGFARLAAEDPGATHISTQIKGTAGYVDPEYLRTYQLTEKSDVYSFGVLLVEIVTGRYPIELKRDLSERMTMKWAMQRLKEGEAVVAMDPRLRRSPASVLAVEKVLKLARQCLGSSRHSRPSMKKCAEVLWEIRKEFRERSLALAASSSSYSANVVERDARKDRHQFFGIEDSEAFAFRSA